MNCLVDTSLDLPTCLSLPLGQRTTAMISGGCHSPCDIEKLNLTKQHSSQFTDSTSISGAVGTCQQKLPSLWHCRHGPIMNCLWSSLPSICRTFLFLATWRKDVVSWDYEPWHASLFIPSVIKLFHAFAKMADFRQKGHQENKLISNMPTWETGKILL